MQAAPSAATTSTTPKPLPQAAMPRSKDTGSLLRVLLAGHGEMARAVLHALCRLPEQVTVVGLFPWHSRRRDKPMAPKEIDALERDFLMLEMARNRIPHVQGYTGLNDPAFLQDCLPLLRPDVILTATWGEIVQPSVLTRFGEYRWLNIHPSLLPAHRGPNPYVTCIECGESRTGVTFHQLTPSIDAGPIWYQLPVPVLSNDTGGMLRQRCIRAAADAIAPLVQRLQDPTSQPYPQDEQQASYFSQAQVDRCELDFQLPPHRLERQVRARLPWMPALVYWEGRIPLLVEWLSLEPREWAVGFAGEPGSLVTIGNSSLLVATTEPDLLARLRGIKLYAPWGPLPYRVSQALLRYMARPGQRLLPVWNNPLW